MQHLKLAERMDEEAISPVVGVMLMLIVVIIIAAVVSGFAGGLVNGDSSQKAPTLTMDVKVINMGSWTGSGFFTYVTSVSKPIPTKDLKIMTSWTAANGGDPKSGGNTVLPMVVNTHYLYALGGGVGGYLQYDGGFTARAASLEPVTGSGGWAAPWGGGPGLAGSQPESHSAGITNPTSYQMYNQQFGVYMLVPGTTMMAKPAGQKTPQAMGSSGVNTLSGGSGNAYNGYGVEIPYSYKLGNIPYRENLTDATTAVFGSGWEQLREGDKVNVKVIHVPTGKVIFERDVPVTEG